MLASASSLEHHSEGARCPRSWTLVMSTVKRILCSVWPFIGHWLCVLHTPPLFPDEEMLASVTEEPMEAVGSHFPPRLMAAAGNSTDTRLGAWALGPGCLSCQPGNPERDNQCLAPVS